MRKVPFRRLLHEPFPIEIVYGFRPLLLKLLLGEGNVFVVDLDVVPCVEGHGIILRVEEAGAKLEGIALLRSIGFGSFGGFVGWLGGGRFAGCGDGRGDLKVGKELGI